MADINKEHNQTLLELLRSLRKALIISVVAILSAAVICFIFNEPLLMLVTLPVRGIDQQLVVTGVSEAFFVKLKLAILAGLVIALPIILWSLWRVFKSALSPSERKYVYIISPLALFLFVLGIVFAYYIVLPFALEFFIILGGDNLGTMLKVNQYVSFVVSFSLPFGFIFELPVVVLLLSKLGLVRAEFLAGNRKYALLIIVIVSAVLTPSDPFSQIIMAIPVYVLYEISILVAKLARPSPERLEQAEARRVARAARKEARRVEREARRQA